MTQPFKTRTERGDRVRKPGSGPTREAHIRLCVKEETRNEAS